MGSSTPPSSPPPEPISSVASPVATTPAEAAALLGGAFVLRKQREKKAPQASEKQPPECLEIGGLRFRLDEGRATEEDEHPPLPPLLAPTSPSKYLLLSRGSGVAVVVEKLMLHPATNILLAQTRNGTVKVSLPRAAPGAFGRLQTLSLMAGAAGISHNINVELCLGRAELARQIKVLRQHIPSDRVISECRDFEEQRALYQTKLWLEEQIRDLQTRGQEVVHCDQQRRANVLRAVADAQRRKDEATLVASEERLRQAELRAKERRTSEQLAAERRQQAWQLATQSTTVARAHLDDARVEKALLLEQRCDEAVARHNDILDKTLQQRRLQGAASERLRLERLQMLEDYREHRRLSLLEAVRCKETKGCNTLRPNKKKRRAPKREESLDPALAVHRAETKIAESRQRRDEQLLATSHLRLRVQEGRHEAVRAAADAVRQAKQQQRLTALDAKAERMHRQEDRKKAIVTLRERNKQATETRMAEKRQLAMLRHEEVEAQKATSIHKLQIARINRVVELQKLASAAAPDVRLDTQHLLGWRGTGETVPEPHAGTIAEA